MTARLLPLPGNEAAGCRLAKTLGIDCIRATFHRFPDGETAVRLDDAVEGCDVVALCTLDRPDEKFLPLAFAASTARDLGARSVGLVCPYLGYMRQDTRFRPGEGITSVYFARMIGAAFDWLVTVDPHLHRHRTLEAIYDIPGIALHAAPEIARWIGANVSAPLLIGPDDESDQWVADVAGRAGAPHIVLQKTRRGDSDVSVSAPDVVRWRDRVPVLVDDIISTARTMIETIGHLRSAGLAAPVCVGVHAVFADEAFAALKAAGPTAIATTDTIAHPTNAIAMDELLAEGVRRMLAGG